LSWIITTGTGAAGSRTGTGHLNSFISGDRIKAFDRKGSLASIPGRFDDSTIGTGSGSRWAARLMATSDTTSSSTITWGSDSSTETYLNVATGSAVNVARRSTETAAAGDTEQFMFKVVIPASVFQPTGTYRTSILFTATDN
jgi:hypothetical protein